MFLLIYINNKRQTMPFDLKASEAQQSLFHRLNDYVTLNSISLSQFWSSNRLCLTLQQFLEFCTAVDFKVTATQLRQLKQQEVQFVNLNALIEGVELWRNTEQSVSNFVSKQHQSQAQSRQKHNEQKNKFKKQELRVNTSSSRATESGRSRIASRKLQAEVKLSQTLIRAKNESDYQLTIKIGEANDLCKKLKKDCSYIIDAQGGGVKIVEVGKSGEATLGRKLFERRYQQLKLQSLNKGQEIQGSLQQDLKKTLVEVMFLSDQLEEQIKLLERKGVGH